MRSISIVFCGLVVLLSVNASQARIIHVPAERPTIQAGITASADGDTVLVAPGTYYENISFNTRRILVKSQAGAESTIINSAQDYSPIVAFSYEEEDTNSILDGFTLQRGRNLNGYGGAVYCESASPTIRNNIIRGNRASEGGAVYCDNGSPLIINNHIEEDTAGVGGVYCYGGSPLIKKNMISNNHGMGIYCSGGSPVIAENLISNNSSWGICCSNGSPAISHNVLIGNYNCPIRLQSCSGSITFNLIEENTGGGIYLSGSSPMILNNTIDRNVSSLGGIYCSSSSSPVITNTVVTNQVSGYGIYADGASTPTITYCDVWDNTLNTYYGCTPGVGCISDDPLFCDTVSDNYHLSNLSPCAGAGQGGADIGAFGRGCGILRGVDLTSGPNRSGGTRTDVSVEFYLRNIGLLSDTYDLDITDSLGWTIVPTHYAVPLDSQEIDTVTFTVSIPSVYLGTVDKLRLVAVSQADSSVTDTAFLLVICSSYNVTITDISDVGNDQGKQVHIDWSSFPGSDPLVNSFSVFRRKDSLLTSPPATPPTDLNLASTTYPPGQWEWLVTIPAFGETLYSAVVPTLKDSTLAHGMYWSAFFIRAGTNNPIAYFDSPVDSGYSLDNLVPSPPTGLFASHAPAITKLIWHATPTLDFDYHTVYRDTIPGFSPSLSKRVGFTIDTTFTDSTAKLARTYHYLVTATDFSGNESAPSNEAIGIRYISGDATGDGTTNAGDVVYLINYLFRSGSAPHPLQAGDATCNGVVDAGDVVYLINYLFKGGTPPSC
ncbi:MAG: right-handed parallel beta-helix repeat-containing protein [Candidatus Zixiibacteriota bacterium]